jgi:hypothetical protein
VKSIYGAFARRTMPANASNKHVLLAPVRIRRYLPTNCGSRQPRSRFWLSHQHYKAWPLATACGGKGLTMLVPSPFARMRSTVMCGRRKYHAEIIRDGIFLRILAGIHMSRGQGGPQ